MLCLSLADPQFDRFSEDVADVALLEPAVLQDGLAEPAVEVLVEDDLKADLSSHAA